MLKVLELFGGIGSPHKALKNLGIDFKVVDMIEFDEKAVQSYNAIHGENFVAQDVTTWDKDIEVDYLHASTPCQAFSTAGKGLGAEDSRGAVLWEHTIRIIKKTKPTLITLENVKGLLSAKHKELLEWYLNELELLGYKTEYKVLNAKYYNIPQNRERVFFVSRNDGNPIVFPNNDTVTKVVRDILMPMETTKWITLDISHLKLDNVNGDKYTLSDGSQREIFKVKEPLKTMNIPFTNNFTQNVISNVDGQATTLTTFPKTIYIKNELSQYTGKTIEINIEKLLNQDSQSINRVAKLKKPLFDELDKYLEPEDLAFNSAKSYQGIGGIIGNLRAHSDSTHEQKVMTLGNVYSNNVSSFYGENGINGCVSVLDASIQKVMKLDPIPFNEDSAYTGTQGLSGTLTATSPEFKHKVMDVQNLRILYRKLLPIECFKLMGFSEEDFYKASKVNSNAQLTKQAGNSIVVNVMEALLDENL